MKYNDFKYKQAYLKVLEQEGTGAPEGAMSSATYVDKSVNDPSDSKAVFVPAIDPDNKLGKKKKKKKGKSKIIKRNLNNNI